MPLETSDLLWKRFYLPGAAPEANGGAMPDMQNLQPVAGLDGPTGFRLINGATDKTVGSYLNHTSGLTLQKIKNSIFGSSKGVGLAVYDGTSSRTMAVALHRSETGSNYTSTPSDIVTLRRAKANQWPTFASLQGNTYLYDAENPVYCWDGTQARKAGVRPPRTRPYLQSVASATIQMAHFDSGWTTSGTGTATHITSDFKEGTKSLKLAITAGAFTADGPAALNTFGAAGTYDRIRFWIKSNKFIPSGIFEFVLDRKSVV